MPIRFKSLISGSSGNCLMLESLRTRILIDCGFRSQNQCRDVLSNELGDIASIDGVLVSHNHCDHIHYHALRVLDEFGVSIRCHRKIARRIRCDHGAAFKIRQHGDGCFRIRDLAIQPIPLKHAEGYPTWGYIIKTRYRNKQIKISVLTDFCHFDEKLVAVLANSDFIYIESNHDLELLRQDPNYASRYHCSNEMAGWILCYIREKSEMPPQAVMLGHLSKDRNRPKVAKDTIRKIFSQRRRKVDFPLKVAPRDSSSKEIVLR